MSQLVADSKVAANTERASSAYVPSLQRTEGQPPPVAAHGGLSYMAFDRGGDAGTAKAIEDALAEIAAGEGQRVIEMIDWLVVVLILERQRAVGADRPVVLERLDDSFKRRSAFRLLHRPVVQAQRRVERRAKRKRYRSEGRLEAAHVLQLVLPRAGQVRLDLTDGDVELLAQHRE